MSSKKKPTNNNYQRPNNSPQQQQAPPVVPPPPVVEEYKPSGDNPIVPLVERKKINPNYKILAFRNDYESLEDEVRKYLNDGWELAGGLATSLHADNYATVTIFAQAVFKK
jgi:hypothetical protein